MAFPSFESFISSPYTSWVVAFALGAIALSGRLSLSAAKWLMLAAGILAVVGCYRSEFVLTLPRTPRTLVVLLIAAGVGLGVYYLNEWMKGKPKDESSAAKKELAPRPKPDFRLSPPPVTFGRVGLDANILQRTRSLATDKLIPLVVGFENFGKDFDETETVWADIVYKTDNFQGLEIARINPACWIDEPVADIPFPVRKPRYLMLGGWFATKPTKNEFRMFEYSRELHRPVLKGLKISAPMILAVTITLTPSGHHERRQEYRFHVELVNGRVSGWRTTIPNEGVTPPVPPEPRNTDSTK